MPDSSDNFSEPQKQTPTNLPIRIADGYVSGDEIVKIVDARQLHSFLGAGTAFRDWISRRITEYGFVELVDFRSYLSETTMGRPSREYAISIDMAKELAMVERNEKGKQARQYFIDCEKRASVAKSNLAQPRSPNRIATIRETRLTFNHFLRLARSIGLKGNQATLAANAATAREIGTNSLELLGITHLPAPQNETLLNPTDIGQRLKIGSAQAVNKLLCQMGLQQDGRDSKGHVYYEPTQAGLRAGAVMLDTGKRHSSGAPVRQLRWSSSILGLLSKGEVRSVA